MEHNTFMPRFLEEDQFGLFGYVEPDGIPNTCQPTSDQLTDDWITNDASLNNDLSAWWNPQFETGNPGTSLQRDIQLFEPWSLHNPATFDSNFIDFTPFSNMEQSPFSPPGPQSSPDLSEQQLPSSSSSVSGSWPSTGSDQVAISPPEELPVESQNTAPSMTGYTCSYCAQSFTKKFLLTKHKKIHTKPITCPFAPTCQHRAARERDMQRHIDVHRAKDNAGLQPNVPNFACSVNGCRFERVGFKRKDQLTRHMRKVHTRLIP
ncbi:uncharacterized protein PAC_12043 [Phialocephala subalpina]|uniref:C2H2-type domain-containing protein n=1 Tax=Phialocephala subalpina TaxID=576137 RepID=A0A1L7XAX8_9HELO|nr:uncharacterized protein PAC_12043 [Phialocephala subalpina]